MEYSKKTITSDLNQVFGLGVDLIQAPFLFDGSDLQYTAGIGLATAGLLLADPSLKRFALANQTSINGKIFNIDGYFNGRTAGYAAGGLYLAGFLARQEKIRRMGLHATEALFISGAITGVLKYTFGRRRPYAGRDQTDFKIFRGSRGKYRAFPSGHTTGAFTFASVMAMSLDNVYWKSAWYGAGVMVGMARIYHNVHWLSDTFLAAVISYNVADFIVNNERDNEGDFTFYPSLNGFIIGVRF